MNNNTGSVSSRVSSLPHTEQELIDALSEVSRCESLLSIIEFDFDWHKSYPALAEQLITKIFTDHQLQPIATKITDILNHNDSFKAFFFNKTFLGDQKNLRKEVVRWINPHKTAENPQLFFQMLSALSKNLSKEDILKWIKAGQEKGVFNPEKKELCEIYLITPIFCYDQALLMELLLQEKAIAPISVDDYSLRKNCLLVILKSKPPKQEIDSAL